jgi:alkaline phosphatase
LYAPSDCIEQPTLTQMTEAALMVLSAEIGHRFALFIEARDVDFALHANNLDNTVGAIYSGEEAVQNVIRWVETHSNWNEAVLLVASDHRHVRIVDDPEILAAVRPVLPSEQTSTAH